jgi:hypothetical protein
MRFLTLRPWMLFAAGLAIFLPGSLPGQAYHDAKFIAGHHGIHLYDLGSGTASTLVALQGDGSGGHRMAADNRRIVFTHGGGLYRFDPATPRVPPQPITVLSTVYGYHLDRFVVNQDGDYVVSCFVSGSPYAHHHVLTISPLGVVRTILTTRFIPAQIRNRDHVAIDIDTGHYLVTNNALSGNRPVYELTQSGTVTTWNTGQGTVWRGWDGEYSMLQNHRNGFLESAGLRDVFQLRPGAGAPTTLATLPPSVTIFYGSAGFDLQTAARPRWVLTGTTPTLSGTVLYTMDRSTFAVTSMAVRNQPYGSSWVFNMDFAFYRGRHLQTVKTGSRRWDIRLSMPRFAGKTYVLAAGLSGVRPGIPLPDGRRINLNTDSLVVLTLGNRVPAVFRPGPGVLDAAGEAVGTLDLSAFGPLGIPMWLAAAVLDPAAPWGIAYLPDSVVMRI